MDNESSENLDETIKQWMEEQKDNLLSMYESYCTEMGGEVCTFEEFVVYMYYESGH